MASLGQRLKKTSDELLDVWFSELFTAGHTHPLIVIQEMHLSDDGLGPLTAATPHHRQTSGSRPLIRDLSPDARLCHEIMTDIGYIDRSACSVLEYRAGGKTVREMADVLATSKASIQLLLDRGYSLFKMALWVRQPRRFKY